MPLYMLTEMAHSVRGEEGTSGERDEYLKDNLEAKLLALTAQAKAFDARRRLGPQAAQVAGGHGMVKRLAGWHAEQIKNVTYPDWLNTEVIRYRQWLTRQGAVLEYDGRIRWAQSRRTIIYDRTANEQAGTRVTVRGGLLLDARGQALDTSRMATAASGPGWAIYVVSADGDLHVAPHSVGHRHHSSLLAGADVAGAGEIRVERGRVAALSNKSGHYQPDLWLLLQTIQLLDAQHALHPAVSIICFDANGRRPYSTVDAFLADNQLDADSLLLMQLTMSCLFHVTNEAFFTRYAFRTAEPGAEAGVYDLSKNPPQRVPVETFVRWMTENGMPPAQLARTGDGR